MKEKNQTRIGIKEEEYLIKTPLIFFLLISPVHLRRSFFLTKMPGVIRRAINAVKDQASISLAKIHAGSYNLDVAILKATSHEEDMLDERHMAEVIALVASSTRLAADGVRVISRRISRTRDYTVAIKFLVLTFHALREGGTYFSLKAAELAGHHGRSRFLDLSSFSTSPSISDSPWDYTAYVRTFARYLDCRLESGIEGKLRNLNFRGHMAINLVNSMTPSVALVHVRHWQRLLDRAISMKPTGPAHDAHLVQISFYMVLRETFDLYRDISTALNLLLDKFFSLDKICRVKTVDSCQMAMKQFEELDLLYSMCIKIGVGRFHEYPRVQMISGTLVQYLEAYIQEGHAKSSEPRSERWELLLVETAREISNSQDLKIVDDRPLPENYNNPFLQGSFKHVEKINQVNGRTRSPIMRSEDASSSNLSRTSGATRQQLVTLEQRWWREQQEEVLKVMSSFE